MEEVLGVIFALILLYFAATLIVAKLATMSWYFWAFIVAVSAPFLFLWIRVSLNSRRYYRREAKERHDAQMRVWKDQHEAYLKAQQPRLVVEPEKRITLDEFKSRVFDGLNVSDHFKRSFDSYLNDYFYTRTEGREVPVEYFNRDINDEVPRARDYFKRAMAWGPVVDGPLQREQFVRDDENSSLGFPIAPKFAYTDLRDSDLWFSGCHISAPSGGGKTNLLNGLILERLTAVARGECSIILMDSKDDPYESLIDPWRGVDFTRFNPGLRDRVVVLDPDLDLSINLLQLGSLTQTIELIEYIFSGVLAATATPLQSTLLRSIIILARSTKEPTFGTLNDILENGFEKYRYAFSKLDPEDVSFFEKDFNTKTYSDTKNQIKWRLKDLRDHSPVLRPMLRSKETKVDFQHLIDRGSIIILNCKTGILGDIGSEFLQRLYIAEILRAGRARKSRKPVFFFCDEAQTAIAKDQKIEIILNTLRSAKIASILSHPSGATIQPSVMKTLNECGLRFTGTGQRGTFELKQHGEEPFNVYAVKTDMSALPKLIDEQAAELKQDMRRRYGQEERKPEYAEAEEEASPHRASGAGKPEGPIIDVDWEDITASDEHKYLPYAKNRRRDPTEPE